MRYQNFDKKTFVPEKNYFSIESVKCEREETPEEIELWNRSVTWANRGFAAIGIGVLWSIILCIGFGLWANFNPWAYIGVGVGIASFLGGIIFANTVCWPRERKAYDIYSKWREEHDEELWVDIIRPIKEYNEEQQRIADAWRAEHPLEEKIRACLLDPKSSVEVANLARYYAEVYLKDTE